MNKLEAGILLPIFSIPSPYGMGSFGKEAKKFIDFVSRTNNSYLQILPLGEIGYGNSPYSSISSYAGSYLYIDIDDLVNRGLLKKEEAANLKHNTKHIDYEWLKEERLKALKIAFSRFDRKQMQEFVLSNKSWLTEYAMFRVLKDKYNGASWADFGEFRDYQRIDKDKFIKDNIDSIEFYYFIQYLFFSEWDELKYYANSKNIKIIGDEPIYSSYDSVDVWAHPSMYMLNEDLDMEVVSGCPPDSFSKDGQVWNNPIYNYSLMEKDNYKFLVDKFRHALKMFDIVRLDHFRGYESFYELKNGAKDGKDGKWVKGPDKNLFGILNSEFGSARFIAEDLGFLTKEVDLLLQFTKYPGMRVLEFGFDGNPNNKYLTQNYEYNTVCYIGTHDNAPIKGWLSHKQTYKYVSSVYSIEDKDRIVDVMINDLMSSSSRLAIIQLQDYMHLGASARINTPGTVGKNWDYILPKSYDTIQLEEYISSKIKQSSRN